VSGLPESQQVLWEAGSKEEGLGICHLLSWTPGKLPRLRLSFLTYHEERVPGLSEAEHDVWPLLPSVSMSISVTAKDVSPVEKMFNHLISGPTENKPFLQLVQEQPWVWGEWGRGRGWPCGEGWDRNPSSGVSKQGLCHGIPCGCTWISVRPPAPGLTLIQLLDNSQLLLDTLWVLRPIPTTLSSILTPAP
jgi:hypothetical protein